MIIRNLLVGFVLTAISFGGTVAQADDDKPTTTAAKDDDAKATDAAAAQRDKNLKRFTEKMNKVKLVGKFTVLGREQGKLPTEEYTINSVKKLPRGDYWQFNARIKYGGVDAPMSFPLEVKWSGDTPVITLTKLKIPALGTFSARVLLYNNKYAGTWTHGNAGGHMFGVIEPVKEEEAEKKTDEAN